MKRNPFPARPLYPPRRPYRDRFKKPVRPVKEALPMPGERPRKMFRKGDPLPNDYGIRAASFGWPAFVLERKDLRF